MSNHTGQVGSLRCEKWGKRGRGSRWCGVVGAVREAGSRLQGEGEPTKLSFTQCMCTTTHPPTHPCQ